VCFASSAFPPVDVTDGREDRGGVLSAGAGVGVEEQLLCPFDAWPFGSLLGLGEQDLLHGLVDSWDVCDEPVADCREVQVGDEGVAVVIAGEGFGVEHVCPELPALLERGIGGLGCDGFDVVFDGGRFRCFVVGGGERDVVGGVDEAAAVDEFGVDRAGLGGADGKGEAGAGFAVVGGEGSFPTKSPSRMVMPCSARTPVSAAMVPAYGLVCPGWAVSLV
jgi:hypothetical protein